MEKLNLENVTLICIDKFDPERSLFGIEQCRRFANFGAVKFLTHDRFQSPYSLPVPNTIESGRDYSEFCYFSLHNYVNTEHFIICQWDGWIYDPRYFTMEFLEYDYVGSPECWAGGHNPKGLLTGGNGGFSLRSKRLHQWSADNERLIRLFQNDAIYGSEDYIYCVLLADELRRAGLKLCPRGVAEKWGRQGGTQHILKNAYTYNCFGIHKPKSRIPVVPLYYEPEYVSLPLQAKYRGYNVTDVFLYYLPVWNAIGRITVIDSLFAHLFSMTPREVAADERYAGPLFEIVTPRRKIRLNERDSLKVKELF